MKKEEKKKHLVEISDKENERLHSIKRFLRLSNVQEAFRHLINKFDEKNFRQWNKGK